ncbi:hypothetical protein BAE44_0019958 [Dichanthelium oligosanthes]|uniref:RING-type E3 ubiquitin transferase n=1 Tax=Dichanthelium oligosanthes TaxID=888268 RepID=A0A1E5V1J0_9POAL|nr:hypothetical protein BAE44_0019958 [Dichanthelium oligosanthes]
MARDGGGGGSPGTERRRVALRAFLAGGEASSSAVAEVEAVRTPSKGLLRGLRCTSAAASRAIAPAAAVEAARPSADWRGLGCTSTAAQAHAPAAAAVEAATPRSTADWRGLGCAAVAASQAHAPAAAVDAARRSEEWRGRRRTRNGRERRKARGAGGGSGGVGGGGGGGMSGDVWCTPGIPFAAEASSVDCVVAPHQTVGARRRTEVDRPRREMMMFRTRILLGRMGMYDQYQDWRLDVDNMTYEEEFETNEETGKLSCGHSYHVHCIKQWLSRKNACPVCKTTVSKN